RIALCAASSQPFGDSDISSMTLTTFAMICDSSVFCLKIAPRERNGSSRCMVEIIRRRLESAPNADRLPPATKLRQRQNGKQYRDYRATGARRGRLSRRATVSADPPLPSVAQILRHHVF